MKSPEGGENGRRKTISSQRNGDICPPYPSAYKIQRDSILKIGMKFSKKKTNGKRQISDREDIFDYYSIIVEVNFDFMCLLN